MLGNGINGCSASCLTLVPERVGYALKIVQWLMVHLTWCIAGGLVLKVGLQALLPSFLQLLAQVRGKPACH